VDAQAGTSVRPATAENSGEFQGVETLTPEVERAPCAGQGHIFAIRGSEPGITTFATNAHEEPFPKTHFIP
jgi:hypothetical protein